MLVCFIVCMDHPGLLYAPISIALKDCSTFCALSSDGCGQDWGSGLRLSGAYVQGWASYSSHLWQTRKALSPLPWSWDAKVSWCGCLEVLMEVCILDGTSPELPCWDELFEAKWGICPARRTPGLMFSSETESRSAGSWPLDKSHGRCCSLSFLTGWFSLVLPPVKVDGFHGKKMVPSESP